MSTILRALKKLEHDNSTAPAGKAARRAFNARQAVQRGVRFSWRKKRLTHWGLVALLLVCGSVLVWRLYPTEPKHEPRWTVSVPFSPRPEPVPAPLPERAGPAAGGLTGSLPTAARSSRPATVNPSEPDLPLEAEPTETKGPGPAARAPQPASPPVLPAAPLEHSPPGPKPVQTVADQTRSPGRPASAAPPPARSIEAERIPEGRMKIQAIAWAPEAQDRMAVINNRILREGESIEGYTILTITQDQVLFSADGRRWKAVFGRP